MHMHNISTPAPVYEASGSPFNEIMIVLHKCHRNNVLHDPRFNDTNNVGNQKGVSKMVMVYEIVTSSCGRVVKALDLKSNGLCPRRFEPCQLRNLL